MAKAKLNEKLQLTVRECADYTGVGEHKIRKMINDGDLKDVIRFGPQKKVFIKRESVDNYFWGSDRNR